MENTSPNNHSLNTVNTVPQELPHKNNSVLLLIGVGGIILAGITGVAGYYLGLQQSSQEISISPVEKNIVIVQESPSPKVSPYPSVSPELDGNDRGGGVEASWLTYTDSYNSYSIKYPADWELKKSTCASCAMNLIKKPITLSDGTKDSPSTIGILVFDTNSQQLKDWKKTTVVSQSNFNWTNLQGVNRIEKRDGFLQAGENVQMEGLYVEKGSKTYVIYINPSILPVENAILSSLSIK
jgi:hypothetical protein